MQVNFNKKLLNFIFEYLRIIEFRNCASSYINNSENVEDIRCPYNSCNTQIKEEQLKAIIDNNSYKKYIEKLFSQTKSYIKNRINCKTPECIGFFIVDSQSQTEVKLNLKCQLCLIVNNFESYSNIKENNDEQNLEVVFKNVFSEKIFNSNLYFKNF